MELTAQNVYGLLLRSKLLPAEEARGVYERWQKEAKESAADAGRFAKWLVGNRHLTEYQANLLARGHAAGSFLNQYNILNRLGRRRMARIYQAIHRLGQLLTTKH